jgi:hypothetical protein
LPTGAQLPSWYVATGLTQGPNVVNANACTGYLSSANTCYVFSDRGTFDYLASGQDPAGAIPNLAILTRNDSASAPGGAYELVNYFHAYVINPSKPNESVDLPAAQAFVNFLTSPALQSQLRVYLNSTGDPGGPPFVADASPIITQSGIPATDPAGSPVTVSGNVTNAEPGYPVLAGKGVTVDEIVGGLPVPVASGSTDASGNYRIPFVPPSTGVYQVSTGQVSMIENSALSPVFGDLLSPAAASPAFMSVQGANTLAAVHAVPGGVTVSGTVAPAAPDANAIVTVYARKGTSGGFSQVGGGPLSVGQSAYALSGSVGAGTWQVETIYTDPGELLPATSRVVTVTVPVAGAATVIFHKITVKHGKLTVTGTVSPAPSGSGARVTLYGLKTVAVRKASARAAAAFPAIGRSTVKAGKTTFTIHAKLTRGRRWVLQLQYTRPGQAASLSKLRTIDVR